MAAIDASASWMETSVKGTRRSFLLVVGSANVDEGLRGYLTKYDCSAADLNPIGAISKLDLRKLLTWASGKYPYPCLRDVVSAVPTAELRPMGKDKKESGTLLQASDHTQTDEDEMGMTYDELSVFGRLRKIDKLGPVHMYTKVS